MSSALNSVIVALVDTFRAAAPTVQITDGPEWEPEAIVVEVAWSGEAGDAASLTPQYTDLAAVSTVATFEVRCLATCWDGTLTVAEARAAIVNFIDMFDAAVRDEPTLGGVVTICRVSDVVYTPQRSEGGALVTLAFAVSGSVWSA